MDTYLNLPEETDSDIVAKDVNIYYGKQQAIANCNANFPRHQITALIGPSGSGKSTFLHSINRMNDGIARVEGELVYQGQNLLDPKVNVYNLRHQIGMLFQKPMPFAKSIYENLALPLREAGNHNQADIAKRIDRVLKMVDLQHEIGKDLNKSALQLSGGQQQRLCLARTLLLEPEVLLLDEPASALDPISTAKIETNLLSLKAHCTIIIVTHNLEQASRISDYTAFFYQGQLAEFDRTKKVFLNPTLAITERYVSGDFG